MDTKVRLSPQTRQIIRDTVHEIFGPDASITVFGSRVDKMASGGDIDLLIQADKPVSQREHKALRLVARLQMRLGDQPIDVLVLDPDAIRKPVHDEAIRNGVRI